MGWLTFEQLDKMLPAIQDILNRYEFTCITCRTIFTSKDVTYSESTTEEGKKEFWIYAHCRKCGYDYNYQKIYREWLNHKSTIAQVNKMFEGVDLD